MMSYNKILEYLYQQLPMFHRDGKAAYKATLYNSITLDHYLGHPHTKYKTIHIAGTNGKGSVSHIIASILQEAGFKTGLYTSPHLSDFRERIKINGQMIPETYVADFIRKHKNFVDALNPSFFELTTAMAFDYFASEEVQYAVIETGLGGRLDCTNLIHPQVSVITNISDDHADILGATLPEIAREKSGIIKYRIPIVIGQTQQALKHIFEVKAELQNAPISFADQQYSITDINYSDDSSGMTFNINSFLKPYLNKVSTDLIGDYQLMNILTALNAVQLIKERANINIDAIVRGIAKVRSNTQLKGRWEKLGDKPLIIADTAHNPDGIRQVVLQLKHYNPKKLHIIFGIARDKEIDEILRLLPTNAIYYFTKAQLPRAMDQQELKEIASLAGIKGQTFDNVNIALDMALKDASEEDLILITGSFYIIGELKGMKNIDK